MKTRDIFEETYTALSANKVRSALTVLGIVIGIASVITLVAVGNGAQASITASIQSLGSNLIEVLPGATKQIGFGASGGRGTARSLTPQDEQAIAQISGIGAVSGEYSGRYQIAAAGNNTNTSVTGVEQSYAVIRNLQIDQGRLLTDEDSLSIARVAVVGPTVVTDLFGSQAIPIDAIGQSVRINNLQFTIVGVTKSKGSSGFGNQDDMIYIPLGTAFQFFAGNGNRYLSIIDVQAQSQAVMTQVQNDITSLLLARHNVTDPTKADFSTLNQADIVSAASSITGTFTALLGAVAGISLLVGGIGIMNMMLTTVTERMREIGLRKAIGATKQDINTQFLTEAVALTFTGGAIGIALGWLVSFAITLSGLITTQVTLSSVLLAFGVSAGIGIVFGWYPARRAANLNPIEALRYE